MKTLALALVAVLVSAASAQDGTPYTPPPIVLVDPSCKTFDLIQVQLCPAHHGRVQYMLEYTYTPQGFSSRALTMHQWKSESARLLRLTALTIKLNQEKEKLAMMEADYASRHPKEPNK